MPRSTGASCGARPWPARARRRIRRSPGGSPCGTASFRKASASGKHVGSSAGFCRRNEFLGGGFGRGAKPPSEVLDGAVFPERGDVLGAVAQLAQDLVGVLAVLGRGAADRAGRAREGRREGL